MSFTFLTALLSTCSLICVSVSEFHTVEVQPGEDATLLCSNFTRYISHIMWFKLENTPNISLISSMKDSNDTATFHNGTQEGKFNMTSNSSTVFLHIKEVNSSDSGLYFCGHYYDKKPVIYSGTYLKTEVISLLEVFPATMDLTSVTLGATITLLMTVIAGLLLKIRKLQTAVRVEPNPPHNEIAVSDNINYAAVTFRSKSTRRSNFLPDDPLDSNVVYAATR
ncbi:uncharacterized protein V6R79_001694 [Siganus canaliculatus]